MATLPRDPLDELIADLERALPPETGPGRFEMPPIEGVQLLVWATLTGTPDAWALAERDPRVQEVLAYNRKMARDQQERAAASRAETKQETDAQSSNRHRVTPVRTV